MNHFFTLDIKTRIAGFLFFLLISGLLIASCSHDDLPEPEVDLSLEQDLVTLLADLNTVQHDIEASLNGSGCGTASPLVVYNTKYTKSTINFTGVCLDTLIKNGEIEFYHSGNYALGTLRDSIAFKSFSIDGRSIKGWRIVVSPSPDTLPTVRNITIYDSLVMELPLGKTYVVTSKPNLTSTPYYRIDSTSKKTSYIYGNLTGSTYNAELFTVGILSPTNTPPTHLTSFPLKYDSTCPATNVWRYPLSGALTIINRTRNLNRTINFERVIPYNDPVNPTIKLFKWLVGDCGRDTATFVSPRGNIYYFPVK